MVPKHVKTLKLAAVRVCCAPGGFRAPTQLDPSVDAHRGSRFQPIVTLRHQS